MDSEVLNKLARYCAYQERCISEVKKKIHELNPAESSDPYILWLEENNYLNESRFTGLFIRSKFNQKHWGKNKITFELRKKGIPEAEISNHWHEIAQADYEESLRALLQKKHQGLLKGSPQEKYQKCYRFGLSKGFEPSLVSQVMKNGFA